jgi:alkanesulfonate monooxygenase SsuD/methylene tetrahydromethanopterin reductase-like flavin-dependent oxidoreductase (luciferase family)
VARAKRPTLDEYERRYRALLEQITEVGFIRSGSVAPRFNYCGKPNCRCHADPPQPHGPYWQWTAKVDGKTVNRRLTSQQAERYQEWIGNGRKLRALIDDLRTVAEAATNLILEAEAKV